MGCVSRLGAAPLVPVAVGSVDATPESDARMQLVSLQAMVGAIETATHVRELERLAARVGGAIGGDHGGHQAASSAADVLVRMEAAIALLEACAV